MKSRNIWNYMEVRQLWRWVTVRCLYLLAIVFLLIPSISPAAPTVSTVTGTPSHGSTITIAGSGFGTKSVAAPLLWENWDYNVSNGDLIASNTAWSVSTDNPVNQQPQFDNNVLRHSKTAHPFTVREYWTRPDYYAEDFVYKGTNITSDYVYLDTWVRFDWANVSTSYQTQQLKMMKFSGENSATDGKDPTFNIYFWRLSSNSQWATSSYFEISPYLNGAYDLYFDGVSPPWPPQGPQWYHYQIQMQMNTGTNSDGKLKMWVNGALITDNSAVRLADSGTRYKSVWLGRYLGNSTDPAGANTTVWYSDTYVDQTWQRVEICNASTKAASTHCEIQPSTDWSSGSATVTVNQGSFANGTTAYLYVADSTGAVNASGQAITFGSGGGGDTTPPVISTPLPSGTLAYGTTSTSMSVTTNETATCKYGTSNVAYASLPNTFSTTGGTSHAQTLSSLINGGSYTYYVRCIDGSSNADTTSTAVSFSVSNTPPTSDTTPPNNVSITAPASGATVSDNTTITAAASDNVAVTKVELYVDSTTTSSPIATATVAPYTFTWNTITVANGAHNLYVKAYDAANNSTVSAAKPVNVNNTVVAGTYTASFGNATGVTYPNTIDDTFLNIDTSVNFASTTLNTYTWPANAPSNAIIIKWNLSSLPANAVVQSATLQLYQTASGGDASYKIPVSAIINKSPVPASCTGITYDGTNNWDPSSIPYNSIPLAQSDIAAAVDSPLMNTTNGYKSWDVTNIVNGWVSGSIPNYGMLLNASVQASSESYRTFASSKASSTSQRPILTVTYSVGPQPVKGVTATYNSSN